MDDNDPAAGSVDALVVTASRFAYPETVARLSSAIEAAGNTLFAAIDQRAAAARAGLDLRPTTLLLFGNPKGGTPVMDAFPLFALELPLKLLIWEQDAAVRVAHARMSNLARRYDVEGKDGPLHGMDDALGTLVKLVS